MENPHPTAAARPASRGSRARPPGRAHRTAAMTCRSLIPLGLAAALACAADAAVAAPRSRMEIQVALCGPPEEIVRALDARPREAAYRTYLFDDASLTLLGRGLRLRLRVRAAGGELTLKAADQPCDALPAGLVPRREGKCEYDLHGDKAAGAVSLTAKLDADTTADLVARRAPVAGALSPAQLRFLRDAARAWPLPPDLRALGPIENAVYATRDGRYDVDVQRLPDGRAYVEVSAKVPVSEGDAARRALDARLVHAGVAAAADQAGQAGSKLRSLLGPR